MKIFIQFGFRMNPFNTPQRSFSGSAAPGMTKRIAKFLDGEKMDEQQGNTGQAGPGDSSVPEKR